MRQFPCRVRDAGEFVVTELVPIRSRRAGSRHRILADSGKQQMLL